MTPNGSGVRSDIFFSDDTGYYVDDVGNGNRANLADSNLENVTVSLSVTAMLLPVKRSENGFTVDDERASSEISGTYSGAMITDKYSQISRSFRSSILRLQSQTF